MLQPLDYILDNENNFWVISHMQGGNFYGKKVYEYDEFGDRYNHITNLTYTKKYPKMKVIPCDYKLVLHPKDCFNVKKDKLDGVWKKFREALNISGIPDEEIGIFGSYLIGFDVIKDIDFVIYGLENLKKYEKNNLSIKKYTDTNFISEKHIDYQVKKYSPDYNKECDLKSIIKRNWSGIQVKPGVLSTPRFILDKELMIPSCCGNDKIIECKVISGLTSACLPRYAEVLYNGEIYKLITYFWLFQSFAKDGDILKINANVNEKDKIILLNNENHWLQYIKKDVS